ncbi:hypothetical protein I3F58_02440 [Streptomyces sp. MUM 203J]|uniref:hypothetical protein n=1 Tax=Streptomyces sp. MUM 203J TaxID=2791990 RepID=UPI001F03FD59|nr:hypothetical protein [Streptomyces sp. MUM 203J]MCH0538437.1 hypothetical protein [Streptomyces sp. MUM 203J]
MWDMEGQAEWLTAGWGRRLILAAGVPCTAVGLAAGALYLDSGGWSVLLTGLMWLLVVVVVAADLIVHLTAGGPERPRFYGAGAAAMIASLMVGAFAVSLWMLHTRGVQTECTVTDVTRVWVRESPGDDRDLAYRHRLDCADSGLETYVLRSPEDPGTRLSLVYDPAGRLTTMPRGLVALGPPLLWTSGASLAAAVLLRGFAVVPRRKRR